MLLPNLSALAQPTEGKRDGDKREETGPWYMEQPPDRTEPGPNVFAAADAKRQRRVELERQRRVELERQLAMSRANEARLRGDLAQMDEDDLKRLGLDEEGAEDRMSRWLSEVSPWTFENLTNALASSDALRGDYHSLVGPALRAQAAVREMYRNLLPERVKLLDWYENPLNTAAFRDLGRVQAWKKAGAASSLSQHEGAYNYIHVSHPPPALQEWEKVSNRYVHKQLQRNAPPRETAAKTGNKLKMWRYLVNNIVERPMHEFLSGAMRTDYYVAPPAVV